MGNLLVVQSKVKDLCKKQKMRMSGDAVDAISGAVETIIKSAVNRAKANKRATVKKQDI